ncbi:unnamed protein product [Leuciscus chuanchicus]
MEDEHDEDISLEGTSILKRTMKAQNSSLLDQIDDLENRSRRANLHINNIPEGNEDGKDPFGFISGLLKDTMETVFDKPPELERAHRVLRPKPGAGQSPRPLIVCFHRFQEKGKALHWARRKVTKFNGNVTTAILGYKRSFSKEMRRIQRSQTIPLSQRHKVSNSVSCTSPCEIRRGNSHF